MKLSEFDYKLPPELIATHPPKIRDEARMLYLDRKNGLFDSKFTELCDFLNEGDVLVINDSKVIPARLSGKTRDKEFEVLLVKNIKENVWETWVKPGRRAKIGDIFTFSKKLSAELIERRDDIFIFEFSLKNADFFKEIEKIGEMPIPPYILKARASLLCHSDRAQRTEESRSLDCARNDKTDYQTVFAKKEGSVAAPTAGLHFTKKLMKKLTNKGIQIERVTLHVSLGTFQPINTARIEDFAIHSEFFEISPETAERLNTAKKMGKRIISVGTTSVRVLESATENSMILPKSGETNIYIYPGYKFKFIDGMVTNFHLPKSSLLLLVSAFAGTDKILGAYEHAIKNRYKFYSYGDGMLIL